MRFSPNVSSTVAIKGKSLKRTEFLLPVFFKRCSTIETGFHSKSSGSGLIGEGSGLINRVRGNVDTPMRVQVPPPGLIYLLITRNACRGFKSRSAHQKKGNGFASPSSFRGREREEGDVMYGSVSFAAEKASVSLCPFKNGGEQS